MRRSSSKRTAKPAGPRERIIAAAIELFYRRGYANTSVDQVIEASGAYKKSFYRYFPSREDLGREYLHEQANFFFGFLDGMTGRYTEFEDFLKAWMRVLRRDVRNCAFIGCPFAALASEVKEPGAGHAAFRTELKSIVEARRQKLNLYLQSCTIQGRVPPPGFPVQALADRIILVYQGGIALFAMSGDEGYIRRLEQEILFSVQATLADNAAG
jgi:TetR/AcrR family transcriptional regulator, transcriptional repressor for nem operon